MLPLHYTHMVSRTRVELALSRVKVWFPSQLEDRDKILVVQDGLEPPTAHPSNAYVRYKLTALPLSYWTKNGWLARIRTWDQEINSLLLYR